MSIIGQMNASLRTDQGRVRDHNEDFVAHWEPKSPDEETRNGWLYIVADGVGGAEAGEVASQFAAERTIHHYLNSSEERDWGKRLQKAMQSANTDLRQLVTETEITRRMATTMVAAVLHDQRVTVANVGDSRGYLWRNGTLQQITKDQSLVARLLEEGAITPEEAINHPRKNVILHSLGSENAPQIDVFDQKLGPGDMLVLCSDGLTRHVSDEEIAAMVSEHLPDVATRKLIQMANERGGEDNISVAVLDLKTAPEQAATIRIPKSPIQIPSQPAAVSQQEMLWMYTGFLCLLQTVLIVLIWYLLRV